MARGDNYTITDRYKRKYKVKYIPIEFRGIGVILFTLLITIATALIFLLIFKDFIVSMIMAVAVLFVLSILLNSDDPASGLPVYLKYLYKIQKRNYVILEDENHEQVKMYLSKRHVNKLNDIYIIYSKGGK